MGCVTSKVMTRTGSFREELSQSLKRRHGGFPALQELFVSRSRNGPGDPLLATYNTDEKLATSLPFTTTTMSLESSPDNIKQNDDKHLETVDAWDLMEGLDEPSELQEEDEEDIEAQEEHFNNERKQHVSQDLHLSLSDHKSYFEVYGHGKSSADIGVRSKSFHTVDEYDAIVMERNGWSTIKLKKDWEDGLADYLKNVNKVLNPYSSSVVTPKSISDDAEERTEIVLEMSSGTCIERGTEDGRHLAPTAYITENVPITDDGIDSPEGKTITHHEKGSRRKARAKDLTSLEIPSAIEFPVIATEDNEGNVVHPYSSLDHYYYVTPKFGSFALPISFKRDHHSVEQIQDASVFDPEMLSAFEGAMQQLQKEEDLLLKQIGNV